jgi:hypothetical protein
VEIGFQIWYQMFWIGTSSLPSFKPHHLSMGFTLCRQVGAILSPAGIANTFRDIKTSVLEGPRGWSAVLFIPLVQLSHSGLLPVD